MTPVILETGVETTVSAIRAEHPGLMFGQGSNLSHIGIGWLVETPKPSGNYQRGPNELVNGKWQMTWVLGLEPEPEPITSWTPLDFYERFTEAEQLAIAGAAMTVPQVKVWYDKMLASQEVRLEDPRTVTGMAALVAAGLLTPERHDELMTPEVLV